MIMTSDERWSRFTGTSADFDQALSGLKRRQPASSDERGAGLTDIVRAISSSSLSVREVDRRIRLVVRTLAPTESELITALRGGHDMPPAARNAIRSALPSNLRALAVSSQTLPEVAPITITSPAHAPPAEPPAARIPEPLVRPFHSVVLVGMQDEHTANVAILNHEGFYPLRVGDLQALEKVLPEGACGFVVAASAWRGLTETAQQGAIERLCSLSTFLFARISLVGISTSIAGRLPAVLQRTATASDRFCHGSSSDLSPADIALLRSVRTLMECAETARFVPLGISPNQAMLLRLIAGSRSPTAAIELGRLGTREIAGGRSGARLYLMQSETNRPFVVKLDTQARLQDELQRHRSWIASWEPTITNPILHHHLGDAAIAFQLQADPDGANYPAPTLEDAIERLRAHEWIKSEDPSKAPTVMAQQIETAVFRAAERLADLNRRPASGADEFWLDWPVRDLAEQGVQPIIEGVELRTMTQRAVTLLQLRGNRATVHGDIHGRNVLLIDRLPAFIDYAASGPGHPLVDLVRLDATVRQLALRALVSESELVEVFNAIYIEGVAAEKVLDVYPVFKASAGSCLALRSAAKIRECCLAVASHHGGDLKDYLAMVFVVSGHVLAVRNPASAIERALLRAVATQL